ncbi:hypothetical protein RHGRI_027688 [Rhododendron griersonianum]|uniref:Uncharacterized protein n=1 Tax=Rhododendron griersonianum TaxID=479676 RepID=A0AAV6IXP8_9ERIC|nr:hypothetical protein RHGRI_027688 [Rhododendron griersonianum]
MALRILLNRGSAAARHHRRTGLFLTSIGNKTNHQVHQKRDFDIRLTDGKDREGTIYFSNSKSPYTFGSVSATIKDPNKQGEILDMAKFAVNEHNNNNHAKGVKPSNLQLERVHEAKLEFNSGATEFHIRLQTLDGGSSRGSGSGGSGGDGWVRVYEATVFKSKTGGLKYKSFSVGQGTLLLRVKEALKPNELEVLEDDDLT